MGLQQKGGVLYDDIDKTNLAWFQEIHASLRLIGNLANKYTSRISLKAVRRGDK